MINNLTVTEDPTSVMKFSHQGTAFTTVMVCNRCFHVTIHKRY